MFCWHLARCITCVINTHCFDGNEKFNNVITQSGKILHPLHLTPPGRPHVLFCILSSNPVPRLDAHPIHPSSPAGCPHLFLISFSKDISLSYPNSPPAGRGMFMMSACVATRTTRSGFFSLPPNAEGESAPFESLIFLAGFSCPRGKCAGLKPRPPVQVIYNLPTG